MKIRSVRVIGCGGTGSHLIPALARMMTYHESAMEAKLTLIDGDEFEEDNLVRQMCRLSDAQAGGNKAEVMAMEVAPFMDKGRIEAVPKFINGPSDMMDMLFEDYREQRKETPGKDAEALSVIIMCVDNDVTRNWAYKAIDDLPGLNIAVLDPANGYNNGNVVTWVRVHGENVFAHPMERFDQIANPKDRPPGGSCTEEVKSDPQLITANMMAATLTLHTFYALLSDSSFCDDVQFDLEEMRADPVGEWVAQEKEAEEAQA